MLGVNRSNAVTALGDLAEIRLGISFRERVRHDPDGNVAILQMKDVDEAGFSYAQATRGAVTGEKQELFLREGDLVFRSRGRSNGAALVEAHVPPAVLAAPLLLIRPLRALPEYLHWFMNSDHTQAQLAALAAGTSVQMISAQSLRAFPVPVPPIEAQQRIAEIARLIRREDDLLNTLAKRRKQVANHILMNYAHGVKGVSR